MIGRLLRDANLLVTFLIGINEVALSALTLIKRQTSMPVSIKDRYIVSLSWCFMNLISQLATGGAMIGLTVVIHAVTLDFIIRHAGKTERFFLNTAGIIGKPLAACAIVTAVFSSHIAQIWIWAGLYLGLSCSPLEGISDAIYFATVTYTTLGYGDITLGTSCRMLSGIEAANGFIMFGWTTAFIFEVMSRIYRHEIRSL